MGQANRVKTFIFSMAIFTTTTLLFNFYYSRQEKNFKFDSFKWLNDPFLPGILDWHSTTLYIFFLVSDLRTTTGARKELEYRVSPQKYFQLWEHWICFNCFSRTFQNFNGNIFGTPCPFFNISIIISSSSSFFQPFVYNVQYCLVHVPLRYNVLYGLAVYNFLVFGESNNYIKFALFWCFFISLL